MEVLWMGLMIFAVICTSFLAVMGFLKVMMFITRGSRNPIRSSWIPIQVYSGDDALDHPDLRKIAELHNRPEKED